MSHFLRKSYHGKRISTLKRLQVFPHVVTVLQNVEKVETFFLYLAQKKMKKLCEI